ncbi:hypothetical protein HWV62_34679 [Athelia sp. TMB]|nr:hypothetical protein HWV62_34679 [Athelia sp. TMB]
MSTDTYAQHADHTHSMEWMPVELWRPIFMMACVDDGTTGCSLSRVSKYIRDVSAPFRYYSVGIKGLASALLFAELLESSPDIRVTHLFLTNDARHKYPSAPVTPTSPVAGYDLAANVLYVRNRLISMLLPAAFAQRYEIAMDAQGELRRDIVKEALDGERLSKGANSLLMKAFRAILASQSLNLATLSIAYDFAGHKAFELASFPNLPQLQELTVSIRPFPLDLGPKVFELLPPLAGMPQLRRLNMLGMINSMLPQEILLDCADHLPHLTHVCLPVLRAHNLQAIAFSLEATIRLLKNRHESELPDAPQFPWSILVQADPWDDQTESLRRHSLMIPFVRNTVGIHPDCLRVHQRVAGVDVCAEEQEKNWRDRIHGGEGAWAAMDNRHTLGVVCGGRKSA